MKFSLCRPNAASRSASFVLPYKTSSIISNEYSSATALLSSAQEVKNVDAKRVASKTIVYSTSRENNTSFLKEEPSFFSEIRRARFTSVRTLRSSYLRQNQGYGRRSNQLTVAPSLVYARRRIASLFRRGNRTQRERAVRAVGRTTKVRGSTTTARQRRDWFLNRASSASSSTDLLRPLPLALPPFVALRIRRRTKRAAPRIGHLSRLEGQRIALRNLVKAVQRPSRRSRQATSSNSSRGSSSSLHSRLTRTLSALSTAAVSSKGSSSALRERRQEIHEQARKARPRN